MLRLPGCAVIVLPLLALAAPAFAQGYVPVPVAGANAWSGGLSAGFPSNGTFLLGGVPFTFAGEPVNMWCSTCPYTPNVRVLTIPVNIHNVTAVDTLMSTIYGLPGPASYARIEFTGSGGASYAVDLIGNVHIRNGVSWGTSDLDPDWAQQVFANSSGHMDKQHFLLPTTFAGQTLQTVQIIDSGGSAVGMYYYGLTVTVDTPTAPGVVWNGGSGANGHRYLPVLVGDGGITWTAARDAAAAAGGHLATLGSMEENTFVANLVAADSRFWFVDTAGNGEGPWLGGFQQAGGAEPAGGWAWVTGEPFAYTNWSPGEPNDHAGQENYLQLFRAGAIFGSTWNDARDLTPVRGYIVEWDACGAADIGSAGGVAGPDGMLNNNDFIVFINLFFAGNAAADVGVQGGHPGHDGQFDNNDFIAFINLFFAGC